MKIKLTRNTVAGHAPRKKGDVVDVPDVEGRFLVNIGKANYVNEDDAPTEKLLTTESFKKPMQKPTNEPTKKRRKNPK